jgi:hypothetical protein
MSADDSCRFNLTAAEIMQYPWQDLLESAEKKKCRCYFTLFQKASQEHQKASDVLGQRVYAFLAVITSFFPAYDNRINPYRSMWTDVDGTRSLVPDDLEDKDLDALQKVLPEIKDPEFRARVADILWIRRKDHKAALIAISSFLESAEQLKSEELWPAHVERLDRAAQISARKGFEPQCAEVIAVVKAEINDNQYNLKSGLLCARLMRILLLLDEGDVDRYANLAERLARDFAASGEWHFTEHYWACKEQWVRKSEDIEQLQKCQIDAAESHVEHAETLLKNNPPQCLMAARIMGKGLEALRRAQAENTRIREVHRRMLVVQKKSLSEMKAHGFSEDRIPGMKENREKVQQGVIKHLSGLDFETAILRLAFIAQPTNLEEMKRSEKKNLDHFIWDKLFGADCVDRDGKTTDTMPALGLDGEDPDQVALRKKMVQNAISINWPLAVDWRIEPARRIIAHEHSVRSSDLAFLVCNNPFIPEGHEGIYLKGIQAGFYGDWLTAMHLLVPQLDASFRHVLQQHGEITSILNPDRTQEEQDINKLFWKKGMLDIFGEDILFDLRGILIERFGGNLRNQLAHALMPEAAFYSVQAIYLWWLIIRLCYIGYTMTPKTLPEDL